MRGFLRVVRAVSDPQISAGLRGFGRRKAWSNRPNSDRASATTIVSGYGNQLVERRRVRSLGTRKGLSVGSNCRVIAVSLLALLLGGCVSSRAPDFRGECASGDSRPWKLVELRNDDATAIRHLTLADGGILPKGGSYSVESWFTLASGHILFCRSEGPLKRAPSGEWWQLERAASGWRVIDSACWGCVLVTS